MSINPQTTTREPWRYVVRGLVSIGLLVALGYWAIFSLVLAVFRCDDTCARGDDVEHWWWTAQFILAAAGCVVGIAALAYGFSTRRRGAYRVLRFVSLGIAMTWAIWVFGIGAP